MELKGIYPYHNFKHYWIERLLHPIIWVTVVVSGIESPLLYSPIKQHNETVDFSVMSPFPISLNDTGVTSERNLTDRECGNLTDGAISEKWSLTQTMEVGKAVICGNAKECRFARWASAAVWLSPCALGVISADSKSTKRHLGALQLSRVARGRGLLCFYLCWLKKLLLPIAYHSLVWLISQRQDSLKDFR